MDDQTKVEYFGRAFDMIDKLDLPQCLCTGATDREEKLVATSAAVNAYARHIAIILLSAANVPLGDRENPAAPFNFVTGRILDIAKEATKSCVPKRAN